MAPPASDPQRIIELLELSPHPEGGYYRETFRSRLGAGSVTAAGSRAASTAIYFLLPAGTFSAFHRIQADEVWHHYDGAPLELHVIANGHHERVVLGRDLEAGQRPQHVVAGGAWQAAAPLAAEVANGSTSSAPAGLGSTLSTLDGAVGWTLCGCTVAPGFVFEEFELPSRADLLAALPAHADLVTRFTRS